MVHGIVQGINIFTRPFDGLQTVLFPVIQSILK
jgi:hypothetical protein